MFSQAVQLGLLWGLWHLPAIDYLGAATPHGSCLFPFFVAFTAAMTGLRVLMAWVSARTGSILLAQLIHASSTGSLVAFSPPGVTAGGEALWYLGYAVALWVLAAIVMMRYGSGAGAAQQAGLSGCKRLLAIQSCPGAWIRS